MWKEQPGKASTPLNLGQWTHYLSRHPESQTRGWHLFLLRGIEKGFRIGFNYSQSKLRKNGSNLLSAVLNQEVVAAYMKEEVSKGQLAGPLPQEVATQVYTSPIGVIPKGHTPGKWYLIVDLSNSAGSSVNDSINQAWCSLSYTSVDNVTKITARTGRGTLLGKLDIKNAYRIVPVHPDDQSLLGISWQGEVYIDTRLPFGLRSAPIIFTVMADALEWIVRQQGVRTLLHYLDDFITIGPPSTPECGTNLWKLCELCAEPGVPVTTEKMVDPTMCLTFLGIEVDTDQLEICLPQEKLLRIKEMTNNWMGWKVARRRELESLLGLLQHAAKVVSPGRIFVRRIKKRDHTLRLTWWHRFLDEWNGVGILPSPELGTVHILSVASGSWGCAAVWDKRWIQWPWNRQAQAWNIAPKELLPIVLGGMVWGKDWRCRRVKSKSSQIGPSRF